MKKGKEIEWVQEFMKKKGKEISLEEAKAIAELMKKMARIVVRKYLSN